MVLADVHDILLNRMLDRLCERVIPVHLVQQQVSWGQLEMGEQIQRAQRLAALAELRCQIDGLKEEILRRQGDPQTVDEPQEQYDSRVA